MRPVGSRPQTRNCATAGTTYSRQSRSARSTVASRLRSISASCCVVNAVEVKRIRFADLRRLQRDILPYRITTQVAQSGAAHVLLLLLARARGVGDREA